MPPGFVVTTDLTNELVSRAKIKPLIRRAFLIDPHHHKELHRLSQNIQQAAKTVLISPPADQELAAAYLDLVRSAAGRPCVARPSSTIEYQSPFFLAADHPPLFQIGSPTQLKRAVAALLGSLYRPELLYYLALHRFDPVNLQLGVLIQTLIVPQVSGVLMTTDPVGHQSDTMTVEAGWGLGLATTTGHITPDRYLIDKKTLTIQSKQLATQKWQITSDRSVFKHRPVPPKDRSVQKVADEILLTLARYGTQAEKLFGYPADLEWALDGPTLWFLRVRPITFQPGHLPDQTRLVSTGEVVGQVVARGIACSVGLATGPVKVVQPPQDLQLIPDRSIVVTEYVTPALSPIIQKAAGIITDAGGVTTHAAILAREAGLPCVAGTGTATTSLKDGQLVTVDGFHGLVYAGKIYPPAVVDLHRFGTRPAPLAQGPAARPGQGWITGTKIYVNLTEPDRAQTVAALPVDGVGIVRAEFMIARLGSHPQALIDRGEGSKVVEHLRGGLSKIAQAFFPRPVVYRTTDLKTHEYRQLPGGEDYEPAEPNPALGYRGARRYLDNSSLFHHELEAIKRLRGEQALTNLWLVIPFVRTVAELTGVLNIVHQSGLQADRDFKIWLMVETPGNVFQIDDYCQTGIAGLSIGSNDLTQLILAVDRDNSRLANYFDERDPAVVTAINQVIQATKRHHLTSSICGNGVSVHPELVEAVIEAGITSISVVPDVAEETRRLVASIERKILLERALA